MKLLTGLLFFSLVLGARGWFSFLGEAAGGAWDMWRAYSDMREANYINSDKYFHARGNYDAAQRGSGGAWAAKVIRSGPGLLAEPKHGWRRCVNLSPESSREGHGVIPSLLPLGAAPPA
ncbi:serum amyloid A-1 protein isoform X2 [Eulemur rufifrons]|uniref:serum amyloid A-1 protein isoform X2 n=1 Tax=Eulemur rufifrons TaxID=859984 RepID=UPI0037446371